MPGGGLAGICGVESGNAAPLVGGPPGVELHTVVEALPSGDTGDIVPIVLPAIGVEIVPSGDDDVIAVDGIAVAEKTVLVVVDGVGTDLAVTAGAAAASGDDATGTVEPGKSVINDVAGVADSKTGAVELAVVDVGEIAGTVGIVGTADVVADTDVTGTATVGGPICPVGVEQVTTVPGVVGSEASGTAVSVVSGTPGWVAAENGLGPLSGEDNIVPGVDDRPMAVVPMVETCARLA